MEGVLGYQPLLKMRSIRANGPENAVFKKMIMALRKVCASGEETQNYLSHACGRSGVVGWRDRSKAIIVKSKVWESFLEVGLEAALPR